LKIMAENAWRSRMVDVTWAIRILSP
jgi:hypothetical protein